MLTALLVVLNAQTTTSLRHCRSWRGITSANWATASNWTNGVPTATVDAVIGDANANSGIAQSVGNYSVSRTTGITYSSISATGNSFASWRNSGLYIEDDNRGAFTPIKSGSTDYLAGNGPSADGDAVAELLLEETQRVNTRVLLWNFEHSEQSEEQQMTLVTQIES
ncbi:MAG: hypothetical protein KKG06_08325 [Bacteroidetes bacterium]|nr:hypothetical protein [Bacteroidota bacterium]MBU1423169.1 hypothetical protein [Bacteroidota bacterium]